MNEQLIAEVKELVKAPVFEPRSNIPNAPKQSNPYARHLRKKRRDVKKARRANRLFS